MSLRAVPPMMLKASRLLLGATLLLGISTVAHAATYDLAACVARGLHHNRELASRAIAIHEAEKERGKAGNLFFPTLSLSHQITTINNANSSERNSDYLDQGSNSTALRLSQPLFSGFTGLNTLDKAKYLKDYRLAELEEAELLLVRDIHRQFFEHLGLQEEVTANQETIAGLERQRAVVQAFFDQEMAARQQLLQVEVRLAVARQDLRQVETQAANSRRGLCQLLALDEDDELEAVAFSGRLADFAYTAPRPLTEYLALAQQRPELRLATINIELANNESHLILARGLPQVTVEASFVDHEVDYDQPKFTDESRDYWSLGLNMSINLFRGGADRAAYSQQLLAASRYSEERRALMKRIRMLVHTSFASLEEARQRIDSAFAINGLATAALEATWAKFRTGLGTTLEILDAQEEVRRSLIGIVLARRDFQLSLADLEYLAGQGGGKSASSR